MVVAAAAIKNNGGWRVGEFAKTFVHGRNKYTRVAMMGVVHEKQRLYRIQVRGGAIM